MTKSTQDPQQVSAESAYVIYEGHVPRAIRLTTPDSFQPPASPAWHWDVTRAELRPQRPIVFELSEGVKAVDFIGTTWAVLAIVSPRFLEVVEAHGLSGVTTYDIEVQGPGSEKLAGYAGLAITGRCGPIDPSKSERVLSPPPTPTGKATWELKGKFFDPASWDGSDFFVVEETAMKCVTGAAKEVLEAESLTNMRFERMADMLWTPRKAAGAGGPS